MPVRPLLRAAMIPLASSLLLTACAPPPQPQPRADTAAQLDQSWPRQDEPMVRVEVRNMQRRLTALGYDTRGTDGIVGVATRDAIRSYQADKQVRSDGIISRKLSETLEADTTRLGLAIQEPTTTRTRRTTPRATTTVRTTRTRPTATPTTTPVSTPTPTPATTPTATPTATPVQAPAEPAPVIRRAPIENESDSDSGGGWG